MSSSVTLSRRRSRRRSTTRPAPQSCSDQVVAKVTAVADWNPIPSASMRPNLLEGDVVFVNRLAYNVKLPLTDIVLGATGEPQRGDIVTFSSPKNGTRLIKRIIALPGDRVEMRNERLVINGQPADYAPIGTATETLAGIGDMMLTANSLTSRNTSLGFALGEGKPLADILSGRRQVTEGAFSTEGVAALARRLDVDMPITFALDGLLNHGATLEATLARLGAVY